MNGDPVDDAADGAAYKIANGILRSGEVRLGQIAESRRKTIDSRKR